jgi:peptidoglycan/LPS O-acetylase OafA/YrhL
MSPDTDTTDCKSRDLLSSPWGALLVFCLPAIAIVVTSRASFGTTLRTIVWTIALGTMGIACLVNVIRCRRVHCYATGPFFLLMALVTFLYGIGVVPLGRNGWGLIGLTLLAGAIVLCCLPEALWGKYRKRRAED